MGLCQLGSYPSSFKFFVAPIIDTYYFKSIGKRKTYIIGALIVLTGVLFFTSFYIDEWVDDLTVWKIFLVGLSVNSVKMFYDSSI